MDIYQDKMNLAVDILGGECFTGSACVRDGVNFTSVWSSGQNQIAVIAVFRILSNLQSRDVI